MKKSRRTYNGVHLNKKSNTQDVVEQSLTLFCFFESCLPWNISAEYDGGRTGHAVEYGTV